MNRSEELIDPKKLDEIMESINTKLAISAIPLEKGRLCRRLFLAMN